MYIDGFIVPVPKKNLPAYRKLAKLAAKVWKEHGALQYVEALADDVKKGKLTSYPQAVSLKAGEVVVFSYVIYKSRRDRDQVMKKVMADPRMKMDPKSKMPFDGTRMIIGGFKSFVEA